MYCNFFGNVLSEFFFLWWKYIPVEVVLCLVRKALVKFMPAPSMVSRGIITLMGGALNRAIESLRQHIIFVATVLLRVLCFLLLSCFLKEVHCVYKVLSSLYSCSLCSLLIITPLQCMLELW